MARPEHIPCSVARSLARVSGRPPPGRRVRYKPIPLLVVRSSHGCPELFLLTFGEFVLEPLPAGAWRHCGRLAFRATSQRFFQKFIKAIDGSSLVRKLRAVSCRDHSQDAFL